MSPNTRNNRSPEIELKLLKRYKKIFLYKKKFYEIKQSGEIDDEFINDFTKLLPGTEIKEGKIEVSSLKDDCKKIWFDNTDLQSFKAEAAQIIRKLPIKDARNFQKRISFFERNFADIQSDQSRKMLYYGKHTESILHARSIEKDKYASLLHFIKSNYPAAGSTNSGKSLNQLLKFIDGDFKNLCNYTADKTEASPETSFPAYASFVFDNSDEFKRRILNVFFSVMSDVEPSDEVPFVRKNGQPIDYTVFRILVWLRNINFDFNGFKYFVSTLDANDLPNRMTIDYGITGTIKLFLKYVRDPEEIDNLIQTHRIVKGLWQNGSKFLNSYTLHNEDHAVKLINLSVDILKRIDYLQLKKTDYYILFLACYLHDLSMVIHPDLQVFCHVDHKNLNSMISHLQDLKRLAKNFENLDCKSKKSVTDLSNYWKELGGFMLKIFNEVYSFFESDVRDNHASNSAKFLLEKRDKLFSFIDASTISFVANAGEDHQKKPCDIFDIVSKAGKDTVSTKYISIVLRLADLLDVSNDRINYHLLHQNVRHLPENSKFHWISHLITDDIRLIPSYDLDSKIKTIDGKEYKDYFIQETLRFYLILNVKSLIPIKDKDQKKCSQWSLKAYTNEKCPPEYKDYDGFSIVFDEAPCNQKQCPMVCWWMRNKHEWLYKELKSLEEYLNKVNHKPFETTIKVNVLFKDDYKIEPHLYDSVYEYLRKH